MTTSCARSRAPSLSMARRLVVDTGADPDSAVQPVRAPADSRSRSKWIAGMPAHPGWQVTSRVVTEL